MIIKKKNQTLILSSSFKAHLNLPMFSTFTVHHHLQYTTFFKKNYSLPNFTSLENADPFQHLINPPPFQSSLLFPYLSAAHHFGKFPLSILFKIHCVHYLHQALPVTLSLLEQAYIYHFLLCTQWTDHKLAINEDPTPWTSTFSHFLWSPC